MHFFFQLVNKLNVYHHKFCKICVNLDSLYGICVDFPSVITVFSAPNYCGEFDNSGAMMKVDENLICSFQILKPMTALANINPNQDQKQQRLPRGVTPPKNFKKQNFVEIIDKICQISTFLNFIEDFH